MDCEILLTLLFQTQLKRFLNNLKYLEVAYLPLVNLVKSYDQYIFFYSFFLLLVTYLFYYSAINIIATFIHNEPTSLPIMQEAKLPQTFLKSVMKEIPASVDVRYQKY